MQVPTRRPPNCGCNAVASRSGASVRRIKGTLVSERRVALSLSRAKLAKLVGRTGTAIANLERGNADDWQIGALGRLSAVLGFEPADLFGAPDAATTVPLDIRIEAALALSKDGATLATLCELFGLTYD